MLNEPTSCCAGYLPGRWYRFFLLVVLSAITWLRLGDSFGDQGMRNVFTMMLLILLAGVTFLWFLFARAYSGRLRGSMLVLLVAAAIVGKQCLEFRGFSGAMIPNFQWLPGEESAKYAHDADSLLKVKEVASEASTVKPLTAASGDWPGFMGPNRTGGTDRVQLDRDWEASPPELLWKRGIGEAWSAFAVVGGLAFTQEQREGEASVTAYDADSGELVWLACCGPAYDHQVGGPGPRATPQFADGRILALFPGGGLFCLSATDGELLWQRDLLADYDITPEFELATVTYGRSNSPLIYKNSVIMPAGGDPAGRSAGLVALDIKNGEMLWESPARVPSYSSPTLQRLHGEEQILIVNESTLSAHDPADGRLLWEFPWPSRSASDSSNSQPFVVGEDRVFLSRGYGTGCALIRVNQNEDGAFESEQLWRSRRSMRTKLTSALLRDGHAYGLSDGMLECIELERGKRIWKEGRYGHGQLLLVGDLLLLISEQGTLYLVEASPDGEGQVLGSFEVLSDKCWNLLALAGDRLFVRNGEEAACVRLATVGDVGQ